MIVSENMFQTKTNQNQNLANSEYGEKSHFLYRQNRYISNVKSDCLRMQSNEFGQDTISSNL